MVMSLTVPINAPQPVCKIQTKREVTYVNTSSVCRISPPLTPPEPLPQTVGLAITLIAANPLVTGQPVFITDVGTLAYASSNSFPAIGVVTSDVAVGAACAYVADGGVTSPDWTPITGQMYLIPGRKYFLNGNGRLSINPPTSGFIQEIGIAVSNHMLDVSIGQIIQLV